jgi:hypothetical protein
VLGDNSLDASERALICRARFDQQHAVLPSIDAERAADDGSEVDETLLVVEGDVGLLPGVTRSSWAKCSHSCFR